MKLKITTITALMALGAATHAQAQPAPAGLKNAVRQMSGEMQAWLAANPRVSFGGLDADGSSLMHYTAACQDSIPNVRFLVGKGLKVDHANGYGTTPLMIAAGSSCDLGAAHLLGNGANIAARDAVGKTALHYWATGGSKKMPLKYLRMNKADLNAQDDFGRTPLMLAAAMNNQKGVERLLAAGADASLVDPKGASALSWTRSGYVTGEASRSKRQRKRQAKIIELLTAAGTPAGADIVAEDYDDASVLNAALETYQSDTLPQLQQAAAAKKQQADPRTYRCPEPEIVGATEAEATALQYAMKPELARNSRDGAKTCLKRLEIQSKVPFRGNTLLKYRADIVYPFGYKAECLKMDPNAIDNLSKQWDWAAYEQITTGGCNAFSNALSGEPIPPGEARYFEAETEI